MAKVHKRWHGANFANGKKWQRRKVMAKSVPIINQLYQDIAINRTFEVLDIDEYEAVMDLRYDNGEVHQISLRDWSKMVVMPAREPAVWTPILRLSDDDEMHATCGDIERSIQADYLFGWDEF